MKTLWVNSNFMHPTTKGGQIRTLEMLRHLHRWHEIHYVAIENPAQPEGPARAHEYSYKAYPFKHSIPDKSSPAFYAELLHGLPIYLEYHHGIRQHPQRQQSAADCSSPNQSGGAAVSLCQFGPD